MFNQNANSGRFTANASAPPSTSSRLRRLIQKLKYFLGDCLNRLNRLPFFESGAFVQQSHFPLWEKEYSNFNLGIKAIKKERGFLPPLKGWVSTSSI